MPRYFDSAPNEAMLDALADALDLVDCGIVLLNPIMRASFINQRFWEIWRLDPVTSPIGSTFQLLMEHVADQGLFVTPDADLPGYIANQEAQVRDGPIPLTHIHLVDQRCILFRCIVARDGGRLLTYTDISREVRQEVADAVERLNAELRFNSETLEEQAAYLASLAETAEENAQKAEAARFCWKTKSPNVASSRSSYAGWRQPTG